jgi:hypothetical protein
LSRLGTKPWAQRASWTDTKHQEGAMAKRLIREEGGECLNTIMQ